ncbi:HD domain-containing protein [Aureibaculum sp. 2210JD6-5]|uniref:HD domain-containing protein n=1 Tax=Aureibaculum sp. 2210JD6-5 TaxID=3103957 RepID=UPI002AAD4BA9|nr:HD domain-containing protein [Aureibaculum sp. 2210JD6-5]MDY7396355.1 HD domain-containing protein [Aureibaculum sp. 2210JD6-5]
MNKFKIFNDPIYGFINIPSELIFDIIEHPYFQRLRRISQMGLSSFVYPGAHHTRFEHAIGAMHLMQKTITVLKSKSIEISKEEEEALLIAILLHDIGHGPFSHTLEHSLVTNIKHEDISIIFMEELNKEFNGKLSLAIEIFKGKTHRKFLNQLISSQLDMDRLDYLKRDSFYTGVTEGNINSERIISMLTVVDDNLVVEEKGIYSVEKFIVARRLMYWMVYLHKTSLVADYLLVKILKRAKYLISNHYNLPCSTSLKVFLKADKKLEFNKTQLDTFSQIDDYDIIMALKQWKGYDDTILSSLCTSILDRKLPKIIIQDDEFSVEQLHSIRNKLALNFTLEEGEIDYFINTGIIKNQAYDLHHNSISILYKNGQIKDLTKASDHMNLLALTEPVIKHFVYYPKS